MNATFEPHSLLYEWNFWETLTVKAKSLVLFFFLLHNTKRAEKSFPGSKFLIVSDFARAEYACVDREHAR